MSDNTIPLRDMVERTDPAPPLFDGAGQPSKALTEAKERYTGDRALKDVQRLRLVAAMWLAGESDRAIERETGLDHRLIRRAIERAAELELLPALKDRVSALAGQVAEDSGRLLTALLRRAHAGETTSELAATLKAAGTVFGIASDKHAIATGGATERIEHIVRPADEDEVRQWAAAVLEAEVVEPAPTAAQVVQAPAASGPVDCGATGVVGVSICGRDACAQHSPAGYGLDTVASPSAAPEVGAGSAAQGATLAADHGGDRRGYGGGGGPFRPRRAGDAMD